MSVDILGTNCDHCWSTVQCCFMSTETVRLIRMESLGWPPWLSHSSWTLTKNKTKKRKKEEMMMNWCLMSSDVIWHIRDKLWPMPKHSSKKKKKKRLPPSGIYIHYISGTLGDTSVHRTESIFIADWTYSLDLKTGSTYKHTNTHIYRLASEWIVADLKQNKAQSACAETTNKGVCAWNT